MDTRATTALLKRPVPLVAVVLIACIVGVAGYRTLNTPQPAAISSSEDGATNLIVVQVSPAKLHENFDREVSFVGRIEAARESELSFERIGLITNLLVDEGDAVTAGQVIGHLDTTKLDAERSVLVARLDAANALLKELVAGPREEDLKAQRAEVERLGYALKRVELSRDRNEELLNRDAGSRDRYEADLYAAQSSKAALEAAQAELEELENGTRKETVEAQRAVVKQINAEITSVDVDLKKSNLIAPFAGAIGNRMVDEGNVVATGQPIVSLLEIARPELRVGVDTKTAASLSVGDSIPIATAGTTTNGTIKAVRDDVAGKTRTVDVLISLSSQGRTFRSGELATAKILKSVPAEGVWLPIDALTEGTRGLWSVYVATPAEQQHLIQRRDVEVLHAEASRAFVRGAIARGDLVVISGVHRLVPELRVRIEKVSWE